MELAMLHGNSGVLDAVEAERRSEGLSPFRSASRSSHFSAECVNECSDRHKRPRGR